MTGWPLQSVAVAGSCMTRDPFNSRFNPTWREHFDVPLASNQSSFVALMSPPVTETWTPTVPMNDYNTWNVTADLTRELVQRLPEVQPDVLLVDFFADVWFGVAELPDGRFITDNRWKTHQTDLYQDHLARGELRIWRHQDDPDAFFELWAESLDRFATHVRTTSPGTRVVVHRGWVTDRVVVPGRPRPQPLRKHSSAAVDTPTYQAFWTRLDEHAVATHGWDELDLRHLRTPTHVDHAWGPMPVHYLDEYHHRFLADLLALTRLDDASAEQRRILELTGVAVQEPWQRRLETQEGVTARQRQELRQLRSELEEMRRDLDAARRPVVRRLAGAARRRLRRPAGS